MSYSSELKKSLKESGMKKKCCRHAFHYGETLFLPSRLRGEKYDLEKFGHLSVSEIDSLNIANFKCSSCKSSFLKGVFCSCGTINDPEKSFHFEFKTSDKNLADVLFLFLRDNCVEMKRTVRGDKYCLYLKKSDDIEDIMHYMGAGKEAFEFANEKIKRNILNQANRRSNFEVVNIRKTVDAAQESMEAIKKLIKKGKLSKLNKGLEETAVLRIENPIASLDELAELHSDRISKSGVNHRLKKLIELAEED